MSNTFKMFDIKTKEWSETGLSTWEKPFYQFVGTDRTLIIVTRDDKNDTKGLRFYRLPVK